MAGFGLIVRGVESAKAEPGFTGLGGELRADLERTDTAAVRVYGVSELLNVARVSGIRTDSVRYLGFNDKARIFGFADVE